MDARCVQRLGFGGKEFGAIGKTTPCFEDDARVGHIVWGLMAFL